MLTAKISQGARVSLMSLAVALPLLTTSCKNNSLNDQIPNIDRKEYTRKVDNLNKAHDNKTISYTGYYYGMKDAIKSHKKEVKALNASKPPKEDETKRAEYNNFKRKKQAELAYMRYESDKLQENLCETLNAGGKESYEASEIIWKEQDLPGIIALGAIIVGLLGYAIIRSATDPLFGVSTYDYNDYL